MSLAGCSGRFLQLAHTGRLKNSEPHRAPLVRTPSRGSVSSGTSSQTEKDQRGATQTDHVLVREFPNSLLKFRLCHGGDLVDHHMAHDGEPVLSCRIDR